jgi:hypothetical protein
MTVAGEFHDRPKLPRRRCHGKMRGSHFYITELLVHDYLPTILTGRYVNQSIYVVNEKHKDAF